jgi:hypothetical protein
MNRRKPNRGFNRRKQRKTRKRVDQGSILRAPTLHGANQLQSRRQTGTQRIRVVLKGYMDLVCASNALSYNVSVYNLTGNSSPSMTSGFALQDFRTLYQWYRPDRIEFRFVPGWLSTAETIPVHFAYRNDEVISSTTGVSTILNTVNSNSIATGFPADFSYAIPRITYLAESVSTAAFAPGGYISTHLGTQNLPGIVRFVSGNVASGATAQVGRLYIDLWVTFKGIAET